MLKSSASLFWHGHETVVSGGVDVHMWASPIYGSMGSQYALNRKWGIWCRRTDVHVCSFSLAFAGSSDYTHLKKGRGRREKVKLRERVREKKREREVLAWPGVASLTATCQCVWDELWLDASIHWSCYIIPCAPLCVCVCARACERETVATCYI